MKDQDEQVRIPIVTQTISLSDLAAAQAVDPSQDNSITIRYDASRDAGGDPAVYLVLDSSNLCKLPTDILSGLGIGRDHKDVDGDPAFFVGDQDTLRLLVDTDRFQNFKADLIDAAEDHGIMVQDAHGDLRALCGPNGDIGVPDMPSFVHAGLDRIGTQIALSILEMERRDWMMSVNAERDYGSGPE